MDTNFESEILQTIKVLKAGGVILYPTDTVWGIGCDALNSKAVDKVYRIKERPVSRSLIILLDSFEALSEYVTAVPDITEDLIESINKPVTVIYDKARNLPKNVPAPDGTVAIRVVRNPFCQRLIQGLGHPIIASSANISGEPTPLVFSQISQRIVDKVDYCVKWGQHQLNQSKASTIIRLFGNGEYIIKRD